MPFMVCQDVRYEGTTYDTAADKVSQMTESVFVEPLCGDAEGSLALAMASFHQKLEALEAGCNRYGPSSVFMCARATLLGPTAFSSIEKPSLAWVWDAIVEVFADIGDALSRSTESGVYPF